MPAARSILAASALIAAAGCTPAPPGAETPSAARAAGWQALEPGLELGLLALPRPPAAGDGLVRVLRIDPALFELRLVSASALDGRTRTARQWCEDHGLVAAMNASMYQEDYLTSVSLMRTRTHTNNGRLTRHRAVLAFDALDREVPPVKIIDLECDLFADWESRYGSFVQSIRMLSCAGENVWKPQARRWSTAAIGLDDRGRVLFVHVRSPVSPHELIDDLIGMGLGLQGLMYAEGGPEAQLYVRGGDDEHEFVGSFETTFGAGDDNQRAWPVPNVVGVARKRSD